MITYRFTTEDLLHIRFAISPLFDLTWSTNTLRDPARRSLHLPWVRAARQRLEGLDWRLLGALAADSGGYVPGLHRAAADARRWPTWRGSSSACARRRPSAWPRRSPGASRAIRRPPSSRRCSTTPSACSSVLVEQMRAYWQRALAPWWPAIRAVLEADIHDRARRLSAGGALSVFCDLHPTVRWHDGQIEVDRRHEQHVELGGRGMLLVPAAFAWPDVFALTDEPWEKALVYTPRGVGELWAPAEDGDPDALAALLGGRRAEILAALRAPAATSDLAALPRRLGRRRLRAPGRPAPRRPRHGAARRPPRPVPAHGRRRGPPPRPVGVTTRGSPDDARAAGRLGSRAS